MHATVLTATDIRDIVRRVGLDALMDETIRRLTAAFACFDPAEIHVPTREGFSYDHPEMGLLEWMPGMRSGECAHIKVVGYHPGNGAARGLPTILSTMSMYSVRSGRLMGLMDATFLTALRTGAASAVASRILAVPGSTSLGLIGCGAQAVTQVHALSRVFALEDVYFFDTDPAAMASFEGRARLPGLEHLRLRPMRAGSFLGEVDILCTATSVAIGGGPVFEAGALQPHIHVNAVGSDFPGKTEVPLDLIRRSLVCPDFADQALKEGECQQLGPAELGPDIHTLVKEEHRFRSAAGEATVFDSTGWALEDLVSMEMFFDYAAAFGLGSLLDLECVSSDPRDPYRFLYESTSTDASPSLVVEHMRRVI